MWISSYRALLQLWVQLCWVHLALYPVIVASSSCLKRSVGTIQMRCLAKILSLIPTTAVQSALQSALVPSLHSQARITVLQRVPRQHCLCQGWVWQLLAPCVEESGDAAPAVPMEKLCWSPGWEGQSAQMSMWLLCHQQVLGSRPTPQILRAGLRREFAFLIQAVLSFGHSWRIMGSQSK